MDRDEKMMDSDTYTEEVCEKIKNIAQCQGYTPTDDKTTWKNPKTGQESIFRATYGDPRIMELLTIKRTNGTRETLMVRMHRPRVDHVE